MTQLNDTGTGHSPVHGFANDGYPIYGPYQAKNTLAVSCWIPRDYSSAATGCEGGGRTCLLVDAYDYTKGTTTTAYPGPLPNGTTLTQSDNTISAASGCFFEDFFLDSTCVARGGQFLDSHNGHSHDSYGYHYHVTMDIDAVPTFPYTMGPKFYGCHSGACETSPYGGGTGSSVCSASVSSQKAGACTRFLSSPVISYPTMAPSSAPVSTPKPSRKPTLAPSTVHPTRKPTTIPTMPSAASSAVVEGEAAAASVETSQTVESVETVAPQEVTAVAAPEAVVLEPAAVPVIPVESLQAGLVTRVRKLLRGFVV